MTEQDVLETLQASGYRLTEQRRMLVDILLQAETPLTAEEIYQWARKKRVEANLSTIYRNLATFCEMGWLDILPGTDGERRYQIHSAHEQVISVMCLDCGQLTTLAEPPLELNEAVKSMGFNANSLRVTMTAHCEHVCPRKEEVRSKE